MKYVIVKFSPLFYAVGEGSIKATKLLIEKGANVKLAIDGWTLLHHLIQFVYKESVVGNHDDEERQIHFNLNKEKQDNYLKIIQLLVDNGAQINNQCSVCYGGIILENISPLIMIINKTLMVVNKIANLPKIDENISFYLKITKILLENGADVNSKDLNSIKIKDFVKEIKSKLNDLYLEEVNKLIELTEQSNYKQETELFGNKDDVIIVFDIRNEEWVEKLNFATAELIGKNMDQI